MEKPPFVQKSQSPINTTLDSVTLNPKVKRIMRLHLQGRNKKQIAEIMGLTTVRIRTIMNSQLYQERMKGMEIALDREFIEKETSDPIREALAKAAMQAFQVDQALLVSEDERVAQRSAWDILDRAGYAKATKVDLRTESKVVVDPEGLKALGEALRLIGAGAPSQDGEE